MCRKIEKRNEKERETQKLVRYYCTIRQAKSVKGESVSTDTKVVSIGHPHIQQIVQVLPLSKECFLWYSIYFLLTIRRSLHLEPQQQTIISVRLQE